MKKIIYGLLILVAVLLGAAIAVPFLFKDKIIQLAKDEANKSLNAKVDWTTFDLTIIKSFPNLTFELNDFKIVGVKDFEKDTLISLQQLELKLDIISVIKGEQIQIQQIVLYHPTINAIVLKNGKANWDITKPDTAKSTPASEPSKFKVALKKFQIIEGDISYLDYESDMSSVIKNMNHVLKGDFTQDIFDIESDTKIDQLTYTYGGVSYFNKVKTGVVFNATMDMPNFKFTFKNNEFALNELVFGLDGFWAMPKEDQEMDLKFLAKKADFKDFLSLVPGVYTKDFADVKTSGKLAFNGYAKGTYSEKLNKMPAFGIDLKVDNAYFQYPSLPKAVKNINIDVKVSNANGVPDNTVTDIKKFHVEMADNPVDMHMLITTPVSDPAIDGAIKGKIVLASVKEFIPLEADQKLTGTITADVTMKGRKSMIDNKLYELFKASGNLSIVDMDYVSKDTPYGVKIKKCDLAFNPQTVDLTAFDALLGKNDIQATGKIENFIAYALKDDLLKGSFTATSNHMDLNQFMSEEPATTPAQSAAKEEPMSVIPVPANLDFVLNTSFKKMLYDKMEMANVKGALVIKDAVVTMKNIFMNTLDGSMSVNGFYNTQNVRKPKVSFDLDIQNFDLPKTFATFVTVQKLAPVAKYSTGKFSTTLTFVSDLTEQMSPDLNTLTGNGRLKTQNIVVSGTPTLVKLADALKQESFKRLVVGSSDLTYEFKDGKVMVKPFDVKFKNSSVNIGGNSYFDQRVDYTMKFDVPRNELGSQANQVMEGLVAQANSKGANFSMGDRIQFDALIGGTFTNPTVKTGLKDAAKNAGKQLIDDAKEKVKAELDKKKAELEAKGKAEADRLKAEGEAKARAEADKLKQQADEEKRKLEEQAKAEADKVKKAAEQKAKDALKNVFGKPK